MVAKKGNNINLENAFVCEPKLREHHSSVRNHKPYYLRTITDYGTHRKRTGIENSKRTLCVLSAYSSLGSFEKQQDTTCTFPTEENRKD
jgi:hypothetical protein